MLQGNKYKCLFSLSIRCVENKEIEKGNLPLTPFYRSILRVDNISLFFVVVVVVVVVLFCFRFWHRQTIFVSFVCIAFFACTIKNMFMVSHSKYNSNLRSLLDNNE